MEHNDDKTPPPAQSDTTWLESAAFVLDLLSAACELLGLMLSGF